MFIPRRRLGRTGFNTTILGIGDLADRALPMEQLVATTRRAIDAGLNLIDTAPGYESGYSEEIVGRALRESGARDRMFVISKIDFHDEPVGPQIDGSLRRMGSDHTDAFVMHGLSSVAAWHKAAATGGAMEQLAAATQAGKTRFRGISSHNPDVLRLAIPSGLCDIVMFPLGAFVHPAYVSEILPMTRQHHVGSICFKTFGAGKLLGDTTGYNTPLQARPRGKVSSGGQESTEAALPRLTVLECLHYTLTLDPDVALLGMSFPNEQDAAFAAVRDFTGPLSREEMADIRWRAIEARQGKGPCWWNPDPEE